MKNPFFNADEHRLRALFRVLLFFFLFILAAGVPSLIPIPALEYLARGIAVLGVFYLASRVVDLRSWHESGLILNGTWIKECMAGIGMAALTMGLIFFTEWQTGSLEITGFGWERSNGTYWLIPVLVYFAQMASVGFYEEVMSRGYLLPNFKEGFTLGNLSPHKATLLAIALSSALFGLGHIGNPNATLTAVSNIVLAGVMLALPFVLTGRLALSIGIHFSWNFFQGGVFGFRVSGMAFKDSVIQIHQGGTEWWTGGNFGPEAGLIGILGILLIMGLTLLYLKQTGVSLTYARPFSTSYLDRKEHRTSTGGGMNVEQY